MAIESFRLDNLRVPIGPRLEREREREPILYQHDLESALLGKATYFNKIPMLTKNLTID